MGFALDVPCCAALRGSWENHSSKEEFIAPGGAFATRARTAEGEDAD